MVASSVSTNNGFADSPIGILFFLKNVTKFSFIMISLKVLLNGPT
jgi:hypothetical protein